MVFPVRSLIPATYCYSSLFQPRERVSHPQRLESLLQPDPAGHPRALREAAERVRYEVVVLDRLVNYFRTWNTPLGYFAAVYREMTASVWECLQPDSRQRKVEYPAIMADFIHIFAGRYLDALRQPTRATETWQLAFAAGDAPMVVHLLASMNAHIRLDLGLALAAATRTQLACQLFRRDFDIINKLVSGYDPTDLILGTGARRPGMVEQVADTLPRASPAMGALDRMLGGHLRRLLAERIVLERVHVVDVAEAGLAAIRSGQPHAWYEVERSWDAEVARASRALLRPFRLRGAMQRAVLLLERSPRDIIDVLRPPARSLVPMA